jgi:hypothetical protein
MLVFSQQKRNHLLMGRKNNPKCHYTNLYSAHIWKLSQLKHLRLQKSTFKTLLVVFSFETNPYISVYTPHKEFSVDI